MGGTKRQQLAAVHLTAALLALLLAHPHSAAASSTKDELDAARQRFESLQSRINEQKAQLAQLQAQANDVATRVAGAQAKLDEIDAALVQTRSALGEARQRYTGLREQLEERAREAFMGGHSDTMSALLASSSFGELADRLVFVNEMSASDSDLAAAVSNLAVQLQQEAHRQQLLRVDQAKALGELRRQQSRLESHLEAQQAMYEEILAEERQASELVDELGRQYRQEQTTASSASVATGGGVFSACPVPGGAIADDFGAPRYGGGFHAHQGNDIFAPEGTPIHAPFDGMATNANSALGGISVIVAGSEGYAYNAHMSGTAKLGAVRAGDVIGYVGSTGDAQGSSPHNHFEWHPGGGAAVDPHPYLLQVC
jgi:murein DD-endopeptidase MepM/ murein hydrolase activator NlpD